jgi:hypothetical protein
LTPESGTRCRTEQDDIRHFGFLRQRHLAPDPAKRFGARKAGSLPKPCDLSVPICSDDDDRIDPFVDAGLKEKRNFIDDDGVRMFGG